MSLFISSRHSRLARRFIAGYPSVLASAVAKRVVFVRCYPAQIDLSGVALGHRKSNDSQAEHPDAAECVDVSTEHYDVPL